MAVFWALFPLTSLFFLYATLVRLLLNKIITAQESERQRIARELHDETSQSLSALLVGLKTAATMAGQKEEGVENILEELKEGVNQALKELHRIIYDLRPSLLDDLGLIPALRWYLETKLKPTGICLNFNIGGNPGRLPAEIEIAIFRITQEAVTNIIKYASARQVAVELHFFQDEIKLQVKDDGCGFDMEAVMNPRNARRPLGILGMKERARLLGGDLEVRTAAGQGTEINVTLPVSKEEGYNGHQGFDC
ncbi:Signal transduction histidine-protein kinase/phosphatase DegS [Moorella humiferrea]|uniref:Oxygen sensor histidine kinase NreB n=1 Tax=Neomoorella humiferrea TaxID=676965 RepID=A0A2T0AV46_9FIRM|nr:Signal transduction histidine-protein kinase/phosphatase DegS [Moorella humiferrea]